MSESNPQFATTQWTLVWRAAEEDSQHGRPALEEVIRRYWQPLYSFARRRGFSSEDAEDATQEFLSGVLNGRLLENADPAKGKFRTFLLFAWKRFLIDEFRKKNAQVRGGQAVTLSLDVGSGEKKWQELKSKAPDPERVFMLSWANSILDEVRERLRLTYAANNKAEVFEALAPKLTQSMDAAAYAALSRQLGLSSSAIKVALHRLRGRFGAAVREVVSETVDDPREVDIEISELIEILSSPG